MTTGVVAGASGLGATTQQSAGPAATIGEGDSVDPASETFGGQQSCSETGAAINDGRHGDRPADIMQTESADAIRRCVIDVEKRDENGEAVTGIIAWSLAPKGARRTPAIFRASGTTNAATPATACIPRSSTRRATAEWAKILKIQRGPRGIVLILPQKSGRKTLAG